MTSQTFYRILQYDKTGEINYSSIICLSIKQASINIYPILVKQNKLLQVNVGNRLLKTNLRLISLNGLLLTYFKDRVSMIAYNNIEVLQNKISKIIQNLTNDKEKSICGNEFYMKTFKGDFNV